MGTWGSEPFENDGAADFGLDLADLPPSQRWALLLDRLRAVTSSNGYIEAPQAEEAIAAAAITAAAISPGYLLTGREAVMRDLPAPSGDVVEAARAAVARLLDPTDNEVLDLWQEAGEQVGFLASLTEIKTALAFAPPSAPQAAPRGPFRRRAQ